MFFYVYFINIHREKKTNQQIEFTSSFNLKLSSWWSVEGKQTCGVPVNYVSEGAASHHELDFRMFQPFVRVVDRYCQQQIFGPALKQIKIHR